MDINCVSCGNTLLIKIDSVNVLQNQFDTFLKNLATQEKIYNDEKLPLFIVNNFSKLFKRWLEIPDLRKLIGGNVFEKIYREMAAVFELEEPDDSPNSMPPDYQFDGVLKEGNSSSNLKVSCAPNRKSDSSSSLKLKNQSSGRQKPPSSLSFVKIFCNDCNDHVEIVNGDPRLSYSLHLQSEEHLKCADPPQPGPHSNNTEEIASSNAAATKNSNMFCEIPNVKSSSGCDNSANSEPVYQYKLPTLYDPFCEPCCKNIPTKELFIENHLKGKKHERKIVKLIKQKKSYEECKKILQEYGDHFSIINKDTFEFQCHICMKKQTGTYCFIQHCRGNEHVTNLQDIEISK